MWISCYRNSGFPVTEILDSTAGAKLSTEIDPATESPELAKTQTQVENSAEPGIEGDAIAKQGGAKNTSGNS